MDRMMIDSERYRLLHGPYAAPKCRVGGLLYCVRRERDLKVSGLTDAPIQWPFTRVAGPKSLIVCGDLVRAVRTESELAVAHHWGVARKTVWKWRTALGVPMWNEGSRRLLLETVPERVDLETLALAREKSRTREARAKMSAARKGRPPHPNLRAAARIAASQPKPESFKRKMSRRVRREWRLGSRHGHPRGRPWTEAEIARLGTDTDEAIAHELGRTPAAVQKLRLKRGVPIFAKPVRAQRRQDT
jgi:hypothetical protein